MSDFFVSKLGSGDPPKNTLSWSSLVGEPPVAPATKTWTVPAAFVMVLLAAVTCDGEMAEVEHEEILALTHRSRALQSLSPAQIAALNVQAVSRMRDEPTALADACAALPEDMRPTVFAHALDLVLADGELTIEEADFLNALILNLKLDREIVSKIADVMVLKNQY
ncbi:tellurite resistance TerB family protein [Terricaulis sp.]|uniref:tellurite resistance TerB family protein n=1 Tax=Terricaulis sp. TaxID=2768686 RepID=UPI003783BE09